MNAEVMKSAMMTREINAIRFVAKVSLTLGIKKFCPEYKNLARFCQNLYRSVTQPSKIPAFITELDLKTTYIFQFAFNPAIQCRNIVWHPQIICLLKIWKVFVTKTLKLKYFFPKTMSWFRTTQKLVWLSRDFARPSLS